MENIETKEYSTFFITHEVLIKLLKQIWARKFETFIKMKLIWYWKWPMWNFNGISRCIRNETKIYGDLIVLWSNRRSIFSINFSSFIGTQLKFNKRKFQEVNRCRFPMQIKLHLAFKHQPSYGGQICMLISF